MIGLIDSYLNDENQDFYGIVGKLEGALLNHDVYRV